MNKTTITIISAIIISIVVYSQITLFVVQPIGVMPKGRTIVMLRLNKTNFIDSPDALCVRETGNLNLLCRGIMLSGVLKKSTVLFKLPYSKLLYSISTNGKEYSK